VKCGGDLSPGPLRWLRRPARILNMANEALVKAERAGEAWLGLVKPGEAW
jgi:hypothetical protein